MKVVISKSGGCTIDDIVAYKIFNFGDRDITDAEWELIERFPRNNEKLVKIAERLINEDGFYRNHIKVLEIPDDVKFVIMDYDGSEWVAEEHREWH